MPPNILASTWGVAYFDADVTIDEELEKQEITYGYDGVSIGFGWKV